MRSIVFISFLATAACASRSETAEPVSQAPAPSSRPVAPPPNTASPSDEARCAAHFLYTAAASAQNSGTEADLAKAKGWLDQALLLQPDHAWALFRRGTILLQHRKLDQASADLEAALSLEPNLVYAHYNLACSQSLAGDTAAAQVSLTRALDVGYRNTANIHRDADLEKLRANADVTALLAPYGNDAPISAEAAFQTMGTQGRVEFLIGDPDLPPEQMERVATLATVDAAHEVRTLGFFLRARLGGDSYDELAVGLCDANGYVGKASAEALIAAGPSAEIAATRTLAYTVSDAPLYAIQVLGVIGSRATPPLLVPFLQDERPLVRIAAAQALAKLGAKDHAGAIEAALANVPEDEVERRVYQAELRRALDHLERSP